MDTTQYITLVAGLVAVGISFYALWHSQRPLTLQGVTETLEAAKPLAEQIREVAEVVVNGTQQLKETGKIATGNDAFAEAMDHLKHWFPEVEPERLVPFIEDAYRDVKLGLEFLEKQRERGAASDIPKHEL